MTPGVRNVRIGLMLAGLGCLALTFLAPRIGLADPEFGVAQLYVAGVGFLLIVASALLGWAPARRRLETWPLPPDGAESPGRVLVLALWFALLAGLLELAIRNVQYAIGHRFGFVTPHAWWMAPVSYALLFLVPAGALAWAAARGHARLGSLRLAVFTYAFLAVFSLLFLYNPELHVLTIPLLAAGVGARIAVAARERRTGFHQLVRRTVVPLAVLATLLAA
ncbi:MAG: hypothetical protein ABR559_04210, partial [Gemmatimonadota bacterium]